MCRQWNLSPNSFVRYANHVFMLFNLARGTKQWAFSKMWYHEFHKLVHGREVTMTSGCGAKGVQRVLLKYQMCLLC